MVVIIVEAEGDSVVLDEHRKHPTCESQPPCLQHMVLRDPSEGAGVHDTAAAYPTCPLLAATNGMGLENCSWQRMSCTEEHVINVSTKEPKQQASQR